MNTDALNAMQEDTNKNRVLRGGYEEDRIYWVYY